MRSHLLRSLVGGKLHVAAQPGQAFEDTFACGGATGLDLPSVVLGYPCEVQGV